MVSLLVCHFRDIVVVKVRNFFFKKVNTECSVSYGKKTQYLAVMENNNYIFFRREKWGDHTVFNSNGD